MLVDQDEVDSVPAPRGATWLRRLESALRLCAKRGVLAFWRLGCVHCDLRGLRFYIHDASKASVEQAMANLKTSVAFLDKYDPIRFRRICRDLKNGVIVFPIPGVARAEYHRDVDVCLSPITLFLDIPVSSLSRSCMKRRTRACGGFRTPHRSGVPGWSGSVSMPKLRSRHEFRAYQRQSMHCSPGNLA